MLLEEGLLRKVGCMSEMWLCEFFSSLTSVIL